MFELIRKKRLNKLLQGPRYISGKFKDKFGFVFFFPDRQSFAWTYKEIFHNRVYYFQTHNSEPLIIDCGANIGISIIYFKSIYPNCRVIAFEPDPLLFNYLKKNVEFNKLENIEIHQKAVWNSNTTLRFSHEKSDSGRLYLNKNLEIKKSELIDVQTCVLNDFINSKVDFLKIDIEGAEWPVINKLKDKIAKIDRLFIESHSFIGENQDLHQILKLLSDHNFRYYLSEGAVYTSNPFLVRNKFLNMDLQINIHALNDQLINNI